MFFEILSDKRTPVVPLEAPVLPVAPLPPKIIELTMRLVESEILFEKLSRVD